MQPRRLTKGQRNDGGFTLVEVLCAMVVLAIALVASIKLINNQTRYADALEDRVFAHWVAMNALAERRLGLSRGFADNAVEMGGTEWTIETWDEAGPAGLTRVEVKVQAKGHPGAVLVGYLRPDPPDPAEPAQ